MKINSNLPMDAVRLRREAISRLKKKQEEQLDKGAMSIYAEDTQRVIQELQIHQIELEMQNDELHRIKNELEESRARYFDLYDMAPVGYCTLNEKGLILEANLTAATLLGTVRGALVRQLLPRFILKEDQDIYYFHRKQLFETGEPQMCEIRMVKKDETAFWVHLSANAAQDEGGAPVCRVTLTDISERKQAEESLRESEEKYRNLFENANEAIFVVQDGNLVFLNPITAMITGYSGEELTSKPFTEFIHPDDRDMVVDRHVRRMRGEKLPHIYSFRIIHRDGNIVWVELNAVQITWKERSATLNFLSNITDRKRMEEELVKADKLESVGILAGGIAHDFNNILTSISGNISMAKMQVKPGHKIFDFLSAAETASVRAQGLTRQLLTFAKGGTPLKETVFFKKLIKETSLFILRGSKSACEFEIAEDLWPVEADAGQINQVISNIVINANQAMPEGGIIRIMAENLMPEEVREIPVKPERYIHISIKDQGVGIAEKHLFKIFDPYFTTKQAGSGLGLATAYSIIKKHNGHISVDSFLGAGTTFHIYLPASDKEVPVKDEEVLLTGRGKILMMDDDELLKELAKEMLGMLGYESEFAKDGDEAIDMYKKGMESEKPYDAVILDLTIPGGMGGQEAVKILLEIDPEVKAIVFSGYSNSEVMFNYRKYGFKGMIPKPFDTYALGKVLNEVLKAENRI